MTVEFDENDLANQPHGLPRPVRVRVGMSWSVLAAERLWPALVRLHERFGYQVHVERLYTAMALDLGMPITPDLVTVLAAFRADVAVYESGRPVAVIELKIFDAASPLPSVGLELDKAQILARFAKLRIFVGVMICPIVVSLEARIERLHCSASSR